jgi:hypothetical protein
MVNIGLKRHGAGARPRIAHQHFPGNPGVSSVNEFLSKRFEFSNNSCRILVECSSNVCKNANSLFNPAC